MSERYIINKSTLTAIGDAIRSKGVIKETKTLPIHRRSPHITDEYLGSSGTPDWFNLPDPADGVELDWEETIIIHGASSLKVVGEYRAPADSMGTRWAEFYINGAIQAPSSTTNNSDINQTIVGDEVSFKFITKSSNSSYGYFLNIHAYDASGNEMTSYNEIVGSTTKMFLPSEMAPAIMLIGESVDTGGGTVNVEDFKGLAEGTLTTLRGEDTITKIKQYAFYGNTALEEVDCPRVTEIGDRAFYNAPALKTVNLPQLQTMGKYAFGSCTGLEVIALPKVTTVSDNAFRGCPGLQKADFTSVTTFTGSAFYDCKRLSLIIRSSIKATASSASLLPAASSFVGGIYVPSSLVGAYKGDAVWSTWAANIYAIEDYPEICG